MSELKISDLSVGDWVRLNTTSEEYKVVEILLNSVVRLDGNRHLQSIDNLTSVPLTKDIMKSIGFECVAVGDSGAATPKQHYMRYEKWRHSASRRIIELFYDRRTEMWRLNGMNQFLFKEVHSLQHALRLAGIDKEIEL